MSIEGLVFQAVPILVPRSARAEIYHIIDWDLGGFDAVQVKAATAGADSVLSGNTRGNRSLSNRSLLYLMKGKAIVEASADGSNETYRLDAKTAICERLLLPRGVSYVVGLEHGSILIHCSEQTASLQSHDSPNLTLTTILSGELGGFKSRDLSITRMTALGEIPGESHSYQEFLYLLEGIGRVELAIESRKEGKIRNEQVFLSSGSRLLIPSNRPHRGIFGKGAVLVRCADKRPSEKDTSSYAFGRPLTL